MKTSNLTPNLPAARASGLPGGLTPPLFNHISSPFAAHGVSPAQRWRRRILAPLVVAVTLSLSGLVARADVVYEPLREFGYGTVSALAISPNNQRLVSAGSRGVLLWDIESARVIRRLPASARGEPQPVFSPDGTLLLTGSEQSETAALWNVQTGACLHRFAHGQTVWALAFLPDGQRVIGVHGNTVCLWDVASGQRLWTITHEDKLENFSLSADGRRLVTWKWWWTAGWGTAKVWDTETAQLIRTLCSGGLAPMSAAISPDGQQVATGHHVSTGGPNIRLWDVETGQLLRTIAAYDWSVNSLVFSPDGSRILSSGWNEDRARLWDAVTGRLLHEFGDGYVWSACFSSDGGRIITQGSAIRLWDADTGSLLTTCADEQEARAAVFSPDGKWLVVAGAEPVLWDAQSGARVKSFAGHSDGAFDAVAFSVDGRQVVAKESGTITAWDLETGNLAAVLEAWPPVATPSEVSPDGRLKLTWGAPAPHTGDPIDARLVDVQTQLELRTLSGANSPKTFSSDGRTVLTATWEGVLRLWDIRDLVDWLEECGPPYSPPLVQPTRTLDVGYGSLSAFAVFPDGRRLLTGSTRGAFIWDIEADELVRELKGLTNGVTAVAVSPNGGQVLTASTDNTAKLWDTASGQLLRTFGGDTNRIGSIAFNVDGTEILVASDDGTIRFWEVSSGQARQVYDWGRGGGGSCAALSLDGHRLLSLLDGDARLWDLQTGQVQWTLEGWWLSGPAGFSPDGRTVAIGNRLIDAQAGHVLRELRWELYDPEWDLRMSVDGSCGGFSPDGQRLLTTHGLWDVASGQPTLLFDVLDGNALDVSAVATLSSDGLLAATGNRDGTVNLWDIGRLSARLRLVTSSQGLQVRWDKGTLQSAETVNGPWQDMTNAVSPFPADVVAGNKFYRVKVEE
jgi:WD40 repeat protein